MTLNTSHYNDVLPIHSRFHRRRFKSIGQLDATILILNSLKHDRVDRDGLITNNDLVTGVITEDQLASSFELPLTA